MATNHLDFIFMKKDATLSQIYRVGDPELAGLLLAIDVTTADSDAFNTQINNYLGAANATGLNVLLGSDRVAKTRRDIFNHTAEDAGTAPATDAQFKPSVYFNKANDVRFGHMYPVTYDAIGNVEAPHATGNDAEYVPLSFTPEEINKLKLINKAADETKLASKIQLVTQSFGLLYSKIPGNAETVPKMTVNTKNTDIINVAVANGAFPAYCGILVDIGKTYTTGTEKVDGVSVELDISYPAAAGAIPEIKSQQPITVPDEVNNLFNFAKTCLNATETKLTGGLAGGTRRRRRRRNRKSSKRRSQKKSRKSRKRSKRGRKSRRIRRRSHRK